MNALGSVQNVHIWYNIGPHNPVSYHWILQWGAEFCIGVVAEHAAVMLHFFSY